MCSCLHTLKKNTLKRNTRTCTPSHFAFKQPVSLLSCTSGTRHLLYKSRNVAQPCLAPQTHPGPFSITGYSLHISKAFYAGLSGYEARLTSIYFSPFFSQKLVDVVFTRFFKISQFCPLVRTRRSFSPCKRLQCFSEPLS